MKKNVIAFVIIALVALGLRADAQHGQQPKWLDGMRNRNGNGCCGIQDCRPVNSLDILGKADGGRVEIAADRWRGLVYEYTIVDAPPENAQHWLCMAQSAIIEKKSVNCMDDWGNLFIHPLCVRCVIKARWKPHS